MRKQYVRLLVAIIVLQIVSLTGCLADKPDEKLLKLTLERELSRVWKHPVKLQKLTTDWIMATESRGETQAVFSFAFADGIYEPMSEEAFFTHAIPAEQMEKIEKHRDRLEEYGISGTDLLTPSLIQKLEETVFLKELSSPTTAYEGTFEVSAVKNTDGWTFNFRQPNFSVPLEIIGGRKAQPGEIIANSPEARSFVAEVLKEIDKALVQGEKKAEEIKKERQVRYETDKKTILSLIQANAHLMVLHEAEALRVPVAFLQIENVETTSGIVSGTLIEVAQPEETKELMASLGISPDQAVYFGYSSGEYRFRFTPDNDILSTPPREDGRFIIVGQDEAAQQKELERAKTIAKAAKAEEEKKQQAQQAVIDNITALLSAGSGFEGSWKIGDEAGLIGLAIESVNTDGSGCTGYLFDTGDRDKRKPFSGVIKKDYPTFSLTITTERGKGLKSHYNSPTLHRLWLEQSQSMSIVFAADEKHLSGTFGREPGSIQLTIMENFADIIAKDLAEEETRQQALRAATQEGAAWLGKYAYNNEVGEFGLYFTNYKDGIASAEVFALNNPKATKKFTGLVNLGKNAESPIVLKSERDSGLEYKNYHNAFEQAWLRQNSNYTMNLTLNEGKLEGKTTSGYTVSLSPMADYEERLTQWTQEEARKELLFTMAIQAGNSYLGAWRDESGGGEISLKITETSPTGINFKAQLYDPAHPADVWHYTGSVVYDKKDQRMVTLAPVAQKEWKDYPRQTTRARFNRHNGSHEIFSLYIDGNALSGKWYSAAVRLVKTGTPLADMVTKLPKEAKPQPSQSIPPAEGAKTVSAQGASGETQVSPSQKELTKTIAPEEKGSDPKDSGSGTVALPKLTPLPTDGKKDSLHATLVRVEGDTVTIALQVLGIGKSVKSVRIDNIGGLSSLWQTDNKKSLPLTVTTDTGAPFTSVTVPATSEQILVVQLKDNGAFSTQKTQLRFTVFFNDGSRAMGLLKP